MLVRNDLGRAVAFPYKGQDVRLSEGEQIDLPLWAIERVCARGVTLVVVTETPGNGGSEPTAKRSVGWPKGKPRK